MAWEPPEPEPRWLETDRRPPGRSDDEVSAMGKVGEAMEWVERARGKLYDFHQLSGRADLLFGEAANELESCGHEQLATALRRHIVGRNVIDGRWTFQIVEEYDATYWLPARAFADHARAELMDGSDHVYESEMKERRRTEGAPHHSRRPDRGLSEELGG